MPLVILEKSIHIENMVVNVFLDVMHARECKKLTYYQFCVHWFPYTDHIIERNEEHLQILRHHNEVHLVQRTNDIGWEGETESEEQSECETV